VHTVKLRRGRAEQEGRGGEGERRGRVHGEGKGGRNQGRRDGGKSKKVVTSQLFDQSRSEC